VHQNMAHQNITSQPSNNNKKWREKDFEMEKNSIAPSGLLLFCYFVFSVLFETTFFELLSVDFMIFLQIN